MEDPDKKADSSQSNDDKSNDNDANSSDKSRKGSPEPNAKRENSDNNSNSNTDNSGNERKNDEGSKQNDNSEEVRLFISGFPSSTRYYEINDFLKKFGDPYNLYLIYFPNGDFRGMVRVSYNTNRPQKIIYQITNTLFKSKPLRCDFSHSKPIREKIIKDRNNYERRHSNYDRRPRDDDRYYERDRYRRDYERESYDRYEVRDSYMTDPYPRDFRADQYVSVPYYRPPVVAAIPAAEPTPIYYPTATTTAATIPFATPITYATNPIIPQTAMIYNTGGAFANARYY